MTSSCASGFVVRIPTTRDDFYSGDIVCLGDAGDYPSSVAPAVGNYVAVVATDLEDPTAAHKQSYKTFENGTFVSACGDGDCTVKRGLRIQNISDGTSKTIIISESRERRYASWFSGASTWVVAATGGANPRESQGVAGVPMDDRFIDLTSGQLALNWGDVRSYTSAAGSGEVYLTPAANRWAGTKDRVFGSSSEHAGNLVTHVFADAHATFINADIDPAVYLRMITRADGDPVDTSSL